MQSSGMQMLAGIMISLSGMTHAGIGNVLGNKGAVAAALTVRSTRLLFICAHFAAHEKQIQQRNAEAARIRATLFLRSGNNSA